MAGSAHEKSLARARENRDRERAEQRHGLRLVVALLVVLVVAAVALGAVLLNRGGDDTDLAAFDQDGTVEGEGADETAGGETADSAAGDLTACPAGTVDSATLPSPYATQPTVDLDGVQSVRVTLGTTCGDIELELDPTAAPVTVANFVALAEDGYYDGVGFHRVIDGFMIQGGDPTGSGNGCVDPSDPSCAARLPGYTFADELERAEQVVAESGGYPRGTVAMANAGPDTNGSQFFIMQAEQPYPLPPAYTVFGEVVSGMEVVDRIVLGPVDGQLAVDPVRIQRVEVQR